MRTDECPDLRQPAIVILIELGRTISLGIHPHRAELIQRKGFTLVADTLLTEDDISLWLFTANEDRNDGNNGGKEDQRTKG